jgi:hypothetical protein
VGAGSCLEPLPLGHFLLYRRVQHACEQPVVWNRGVPNCDNNTQPALTNLSQYPSTTFNTISGNTLGATNTYLIVPASVC